MTVSASKKDSKRMGLVVWDDGTFGTGVGQQNTVTYTQPATDPIAACLKLNASYGSAKIIKTSEDGKVQIANLHPGEYTVTEQMVGDYVPQEPQKVMAQAGDTCFHFLKMIRQQDALL